MASHLCRSSTSILVLLAVTATACGEPPDRVLTSALAALEAGHSEDLGRSIADDYTDALGGKEALLADARDLANAFGRIALHASELSIVPRASKLEVEVVGRLDAELVGNPTRWQITGPIQVTLRREDGFQIRSGLLTDLRDIRHLTIARRAALEANDAAGYARLLHPTYRDGDVGREETARRLARDLQGVRLRLEPTLYKLELRGPNAHLDEHYVLTVGEQTLPAAIARLSLLPAAGLWKIAAGLYPGAPEPP